MNKPSLTGNLYMPGINVTYTTMTKDANNPYRPARHDSAHITVLKLRNNKHSAYTDNTTPSSRKVRPHFESCTSLGENQYLDHGSRGN
jgi:hypothetical protein